MKLKRWKHGNGWMTAKQKKSHDKEQKEAYDCMMENPFERAIFKRYLEIKASQKAVTK